MKEIDLKLTGMSCASCALSIEKEVLNLAGVAKSTVNFATETGHFEVGDEVEEANVIQAISKIGYGAIKLDNSISPDVEENSKNKDDNLTKFIISIILSVLIFLFAMWPFMDMPTRQINWIIQLVLCTPIWFWIGYKFQKSLWNFIKTGRSGMNTLIGLGTSAAYLYSTFITIFHDYSIALGLNQAVYFEAVGFIISFVYLGQYFEVRAKKKTKEALNSLFKLSSKFASVVKDDEVHSIPVDQVKIADILRVLPGEKFPVDGVVLKGESFVDESTISGEPVPVLKNKSMKVFAGTINGDGVIDFKAQKIGADTFLSQIIKYVESAQNSKPEIQKYADRISSIFTPIVIIISILTFAFWFIFGAEPKWANSISNFIAVLVIACPCALGLATPTAVVVATGRASLKGLLISGGDILEKASEIDTIVFDKTGTITEGKPAVISSKFEESIKDQENQILLEVASIEQFSQHPLSKAIVNYSKELNLKLSEPDSFNAVKGKGIISAINGNNYVIGNEQLLIDHLITVKKELIPSEVGSLIFVAKNSLHVGVIVVGDKIKDSSFLTIKRLKELGIRTLMITGDNERVAKEVCQEVGIDEFYAGELPLGKALIIERLIKEGKQVAMVGDGVNDAPALAKATLSLAMGTGSDVAINASDVTIVKGDLSKALDFLILSKKTMSIIKQNLFLSMIYNAVLIPIAAGLLVVFGGPMMPPILASVAMGMSSICVVSNSLRIKNII